MTVNVSCLDQESTKKQARGTPVGISLAGLVRRGEAHPGVRGASLQSQIREERRRTALFACLPSLLLASSPTLSPTPTLLHSFSGFPCRLKTRSSPDILQAFISKHGLLRHPATWSEQLPHSAVHQPLLDHSGCVVQADPPFNTHSFYRFCPFREP